MAIVEYRVRPVTRFIITRYHKDDHGAASEPIGFFESAWSANMVAKALHGGEPGSLCFLTDHPDQPTGPVSRD